MVRGCGLCGTVILAALCVHAGVAGGSAMAEESVVAVPFYFNGVLSVVAVHPSAVCGTEHPDVFFEQFRSAVARGDIPDPAARALTPVAPRKPLPMGGGMSTLDAGDLFLYEDSDNLLSTNFSDEQLFFFMGEATASLLEKHGDNFDFVAFFLNFTADHQIGAAFYLGLENQAEGLGLGTFDRRFIYGVPGENVEGWVNMWNVNGWSPGSSSAAGFTRLVLGQEFEHRWAMFLDPLPGGRSLQGDNGPCGRGSHWNFKVDGQGSGMEIAEWVGTNPAHHIPGTLHFNSDIQGVFSATDLYLMGYLSPPEMDARNSELRYMDASANCSGNYSGPIFNFSSFQIIQANGPRIPSAETAQKNFRVGWIMVHRPGFPPTATDIDRALGIMKQQQLDWFYGTLGKGTLSASVRETLGADFDGDGDVDLNDYGSFDACFTGAEGTTLAPGCEVFDDDADDDVDLIDFATFMRAFRGDCGILITEQPADVTACPGGPVILSVQTDGDAFGYQWTLDGVPINGATGSSLVINAAGPEDAGAYRVSVFGECHVAHSEAATLAIHEAPVFTTQPADTGTCDQGTAELTVAVAGVAPLSYQWQFMGADIPGAVDATLMLDNVDAGDLGSYRCVVTDGCEQVSVSESAEVFFTPPAVITLQPQSAEVCEGDIISLVSSASGIATFQWFKDDVPVDGATQPFLFIPNAAPSDSGTYHAVATGPCNADVSDDAVIDVIDCGGGP